VASSVRDGRAELPSRLRDVLLLRTSSCSATAQVVLRVAAATGRRVDERLLAAVAPLPESELLAGLREAVDHQLLVIRPDEDVYEFRHALLQEAVYGELLPGERGRLHAALASTLTERLDSGELDWSASAAEIALHWYRAHTWPSALEWSARAAAEADQMHAYAEAARHYERALELWDRVPDARVRTGVDRAEVLERAAEAGRMSGDSGHALVLVERALREVDPMVEPVRAGLLHERRGEYLMYARDLNSRFDALREAVRLVPIVPPSRERARVLASFADALAMAGLEEEARAASEEAIEIAHPIGAERELGYALVVLGWSQATRGALEAGIASLREACRLGEKHSDPELARRAYGWLGEELMQSGRLEEAVDVLLSGREVLRRLGVAGYRPDTYLLASAADALLKLGRWDEADRLARQALAQAQPDARLPFVVVAMLEVGRGAFEAAEAHLKAIEDGALSGMPEGARMYLSAMAELRIWQGRLDEARAAVSEGLDRVAGTDEARSGRLICLGMRAEADRAERGRAHRDRDAVAEATRAAEALVSRVATMAPNPLVSVAAAVPSTTAVRAQWEGERTRLAGRSDPAHWQATAEAWLALRRPYPAAYAQWRQAEALLYQREPVSRAVEPLQAARATALRLGARPLLAEIESLARRGRITLEVPQVETEVAASSPVDQLGLTDRELEVLRHLAAGRSNREIGEVLFISAKTASVHISNIFRKLDVTSRVQAAAVAHRLGLVDEDLPGA
jgi:DNA-binding CsgD family transcriptional regulator/tetratricopeptide (TPR) repeat protein